MGKAQVETLGVGGFCCQPPALRSVLPQSTWQPCTGSCRIFSQDAAKTRETLREKAEPEPPVTRRPPFAEHRGGQLCLCLSRIPSFLFPLEISPSLFHHPGGSAKYHTPCTPAPDHSLPGHGFGMRPQPPKQDPPRNLITVRRQTRMNVVRADYLLMATTGKITH